MMWMSRIWEARPGSGAKSACGACEHESNSVALESVVQRRRARASPIGVLLEAAPQHVTWGYNRQLFRAMDRSGYALIETIRVRDGRIPFLERHLARLARSLTELGLPTPRQDVAALVRPFAGTGDAVLRIEVQDGRASVTVRERPPLEPPAVITASTRHAAYSHKTTARE